ncbi:hypothetical protein PR048_012739 [Dryococelus australis]|uniref:Uncharacterized protein n=1 Tax=Dryococelus australis TaxID=614101 RepID=A0ABQ9HQ75_9NEOP|nr:hypothetical protein PR048_012739 [Dryococelus australis]
MDRTVWYMNSPGIFFDDMLHKTGVELNLLIGRVAQYIMHHVLANNKEFPTTHVSWPSTYLQYVNTNNLFGWRMPLLLPCGGFEWTGTDIDMIAVPDDSLIGYILEVEHSRYCNNHTPIHADIKILQKNAKSSMLIFHNYHNISKVPIIMNANCEATLVPFKTCMPNHLCCHL